MMTDPIADMFIRIRNALAAEKVAVRLPASRQKLAIAEVLRQEGYIEGVSRIDEGGKPLLEIALKYHEGKPVIERLERVSRPGYRRYAGRTKLPQIDGGLGVAIVSTSKGIMSERSARSAGLGGELLGIVS